MFKRLTKNTAAVSVITITAIILIVKGYLMLSVSQNYPDQQLAASMLLVVSYFTLGLLNLHFRIFGLVLLPFFFALIINNQVIYGSLITDLPQLVIAFSLTVGLIFTGLGLLIHYLTKYPREVDSDIIQDDQTSETKPTAK